MCSGFMMVYTNNKQEKLNKDGMQQEQYELVNCNKNTSNKEVGKTMKKAHGPTG